MDNLPSRQAMGIEYPFEVFLKRCPFTCNRREVNYFGAIEMPFENLGQDWQQDFISINLLAIGYNAWMGYLGGERGVVVCGLNSPLIGVAGETFKAHFVPRRRLAAFLNAWLAAPDTVILQHHQMSGHILHAVDTCNPLTDVILLLESGQQVTFFYLRNLPITPPQCYEQICKEWAEFQPQSTPLKKEKLWQD